MLAVSELERYTDFFRLDVSLIIISRQWAIWPGQSKSMLIGSIFVNLHGMYLLRGRPPYGGMHSSTCRWGSFALQFALLLERHLKPSF